MLSERKYKKTNENDIEGKDEDHRGEKCNLLDCLHDGMDFPNVRHQSQQVLLNEPSQLCQLAVCYAWRQAIGVIIKRREKKKKEKNESIYIYARVPCMFNPLQIVKFLRNFYFHNFPRFLPLLSLSLSLSLHCYILYKVLRFDESLFFFSSRSLYQYFCTFLFNFTRKVELPARNSIRILWKETRTPGIFPFANTHYRVLLENFDSRPVKFLLFLSSALLFALFVVCICPWLHRETTVAGSMRASRSWNTSFV